MNKSEFNFQEIIEELDELLRQEQDDVKRRVSYSAPQSYNDEMNGTARGVSIARQIVHSFLNEKLKWQ